MVVDGFASLKTDQDKLVAGQRNLEDELGRLRSRLDSPVRTTMARGSVKGHVGERSSVATERTTATSAAAVGLATGFTAEVVASVGAAAGSVSRVQAPDSPAPSPVSSPENEGEQPEVDPMLELTLELDDRMDRMYSFLDSLEGGAGQTPSVESVREVTVDSGDLEVSLVPQEVREAVTGDAHQEMEARDERGGVEVTRRSPARREVQRPRTGSDERPNDPVVRTATRSGPSTTGSTANVLASAGSVGAAAGGARSVSRVQAPNSPAPSPVSSPENEGERPEIISMHQRTLALSDRMDRMSSLLDLLEERAGQTPSVHSIREVTVGSGDLDESLVPGEAAEAVTKGAPKDMEGRDDGGPAVEVTNQMSGETPVVEATVASGGLALEVDGAQLEMVEEITSETAGSSRETVPDTVARPPVSWAENAERAENPIAAAKKAEEGSIVPAVESGAAAVGTVAVTPGTLTIMTRKVSSEERQMAGAPQGQIFDVVALKRSEVPATVDVSQDLEAVQATVGVKDWAGLFAAVSSARALLLHHRDVLEAEDGGPRLIGRLVSLVADAVSNRRSIVQMNGLRCLGEMFSCVVGKGMTADQMGTLVRPTLSCHKSSSKFCGEEAKKAMEAALANADPVLLLSAVLPQALDRHPKVARQGVIYTAEAARRRAVWWMVWT
ncbi:unnamed protein product [Ectocarpus sp. 4 AP-2014]